MRRMRAVAAAGVVVAMGALAPTTAAAGQVRLAEVSCTGTDWVEIANATGARVPLDGWLLTDDPVDRDPPRAGHRFTFPAGTTVPAGGTLLVAASEVPETGFAFGLSCDDTVRLADPSGVIADEVSLDDGGDDAQTFARDADGAWRWGDATPGAGPGEDGSAGPAGVFDPFQVTDVDIELGEDAITALRDDPGTYVDGTVRLRGARAHLMPYRVGVRLKGSGSFRTLDGKAAFKIKVGHSVPRQRMFGLKGLTLNNMVQDPAMIAEATTSHLARAMGVAAPRVGSASVRLNGVEYGLYANVENFDEVMTSRWFPSTAHLYEHGDYGVDVTPGRAGDFEVDEGDEDDRADLERLIEVVSGPVEGWSQVVSTAADLRQMSRMWALEHYAGHWDGYSLARDPLHPNNYYLHADDDGAFSMLPSGADQTWELAVSFGAVGHGVLFERCIADVACRAGYVDALRAAHATAASLDLPGYARALAAALAPWREADPRAEPPQPDGADGLEAKLALIDARQEQLERWLARPSFAPDPLPQGTDVSPPGGPGTPDPPPPDAAEPDAPVADPPPPEAGAAPAPPAVTLLVATRVRTSSGTVRVTRSVRTPRRGSGPVGVAARVLPSSIAAPERRRAALALARAAADRLNATMRAPDGTNRPWALGGALRWRAADDGARALILPLQRGEAFLALGAASERRRSCRAAGVSTAAVVRHGVRFVVIRPAAAAPRCA